MARKKKRKGKRGGPQFIFLATPLRQRRRCELTIQELSTCNSNSQNMYENVFMFFDQLLTSFHERLKRFNILMMKHLFQDNVDFASLNLPAAVF